MGLPYFKSVTWILTILAFMSRLHVKSEIQECSLEGIELQHCLALTTNTTTFSLDTCCVTLNQAVQAGYYCICSLLSPSDYSSFTTALALSLSSCYISVPPLTHCQVLQPRPEIATSFAAVTVLNQPPPNQPLPPKVKEIPSNFTHDDSSASDTMPAISSSPLSELNNVMSDAANVKIVVNIRILLTVGIYATVHKNLNFLIYSL